MDLRKVKKLIELLENSELLEMEITEGESTIRLSRGMSSLSPPVTAYGVGQNMGALHTPGPKQVNGTQETGINQVNTDVSGNTINSPMVGTFYDAPSPDSDPYVALGSVVKPGDTLCIIEAMKTFNQFESEFTGTIKAIYKSNGDPVEFGEPLFLID